MLNVNKLPLSTPGLRFNKQRDKKYEDIPAIPFNFPEIPKNPAEYYKLIPPIPTKAKIQKMSPQEFLRNFADWLDLFDLYTRNIPGFYFFDPQSSDYKLLLDKNKRVIFPCAANKESRVLYPIQWRGFSWQILVGIYTNFKDFAPKNDPKWNAANDLECKPIPLTKWGSDEFSWWERTYKKDGIEPVYIVTANDGSETLERILGLHNGDNIDFLYRAIDDISEYLLATEKYSFEDDKIYLHDEDKKSTTPKITWLNRYDLSKNEKDVFGNRVIDNLQIDYRNLRYKESFTKKDLHKLTIDDTIFTPFMSHPYSHKWFHEPQKVFRFLALIYPQLKVIQEQVNAKYNPDEKGDIYRSEKSLKKKET